MTAPTSTPSPQAAQEDAPEQETELWMLAGLARVIHWCEELLALINGPVLLFGLGIALVDLLTDGQLTTDVPILLIAWGVSQALGIDTQLLGCWSRVRRAWEREHYRQMLAWVVLGFIIGYAAWQAGDVFAVQQSQHISESAALAQLGMSATVWFGWRAFLAVGLVALAGITRYQKPRKVRTRTDLAYERDELHAQLELEPLRQRLAEQRAAGVGRRVHSALGGMRGIGDDMVSTPGTYPLEPPFHSALPGPSTPTDEPFGSSPVHSPVTQAAKGARGTSEKWRGPSDDKPPTGGGSPSSVDSTNGPQTGASSGPAHLVALPGKSAKRPAALKQRDKSARAALETRRREFASQFIADAHGDVTPNALREALNHAGMGPAGWQTAARLIRNYRNGQRRQSLAQ